MNSTLPIRRVASFGSLVMENWVVGLHGLQRVRAAGMPAGAAVGVVVPR